MKKSTCLCLLLIVVLALTGCTMYRQPAPGDQPGQPQQPNMPDIPQEPNPPGQPGDNQGNILGQPLASNISSRAMEITGVRNAVAIVIGNLAMIGVEIENGVDATQVKENVSTETEQNFSEIETALVTAEVDLVDKISATSEKISQGRPTSELMSDLFDIWQRMNP